MAILIVDDSEDICLLLKSMLEAAGHSDLIRAGSAAEALSILGVGTDPSSQKVDLILMDVDMPEMDGVEACRRIKEVASGHRVRDGGSCGGRWVVRSNNANEGRHAAVHTIRSDYRQTIFTLAGGAQSRVSHVRIFE